MHGILTSSMEPNIPTSFIPKRPVSSEPIKSHTSNRSVGLLSLFAVVCVIAAVVGLAGVFVFGKQLESKKIKMKQEINQARDGLGTEFVTDMKRLDARIDGVEMLINNHIVVSPIFESLRQTTLRSVQYNNFSYSITSDTTSKTSMVEVEMSGTAAGYATIALQSDAFSKNGLIRNPVFSGLTIDEKTDRVNFNLSFSVNPSDLSYQKFIASNASVNNMRTP